MYFNFVEYCKDVITKYKSILKYLLFKHNACIYIVF